MLAKDPTARPWDRAEAVEALMEGERLERESREKDERAAKEVAESDRLERESCGKAERGAREKAEREAKEKAEREAREKAVRDANEKAEREAAEKAQREVEKCKRKELALELAPGVMLELVRVPAGEFLMGLDKAKDKHAYDDETPQHILFLPEYLIGKTPVTVASLRRL